MLRHLRHRSIISLQFFKEHLTVVKFSVSVFAGYRGFYPTAVFGTSLLHRLIRCEQRRWLRYNGWLCPCRSVSSQVCLSILVMLEVAGPTASTSLQTVAAAETGSPAADV